MRVWLWALAVLACLAMAAGQEGDIAAAGKKGGKARRGSRVVRYTWNVKVGQRSPDCVSRPVILVSGQFQPTITVRQGDTLEVGSSNSSSIWLLW
jgi:L-ascorbate oxidase